CGRGQKVSTRRVAGLFGLSIGTALLRRTCVGAAAAVDIEATPMGSEGGYAVNVVWTLVTGAIVFWMQAGFALLEAGVTRAKNVVNILMMNFADTAVSSIMFWACGFGPLVGAISGLFGTDGFFLIGY